MSGDGASRSTELETRHDLSTEQDTRPAEGDTHGAAGDTVVSHTSGPEAPPSDAATQRGQGLSLDDRATSMLSPEQAAKAVEATARTADFTDAADQTLPHAHHLVTIAGDAAGEDASLVDGRTLAGTEDMTAIAGAVTWAAVDAGATEVDADPNPTAMEQRPGRTNEVDPAHLDARAALDAKIRAHLDVEKPKAKRDPMLGTTVGGRFQIVSRIGAGGMGAVYRAKQKGIDRDVAVKVLLQELTSNETLTRRFTIEALAVSRLKHPHTIQIFDFGRTDAGNLYIAMELLEGDTLYAEHARHKRLPVRRALRIISQVAGSLSEAHGKEIVHRDLKPENIFLTRVGDNADFVKVLDFGVAKLRDGVGDGKGTLTQAGSIFGTPRYMSPEQASARPVDARSDIYALGVILYELIVGHPPFQSDTPLTLLLAHVNDRPRAPSAAAPDIAIPLEAEDLILRLLEKSPDDRVQTAGELERVCMELAVKLPEAFDRPVALDEASDLGVALSAPATVHVPMAGHPADTVQQVGPSTAPVAPATKRRGPLLLLLLGGVVVLGGVAGLVLNPDTPPAPKPTPSVAPRPVKAKAPTEIRLQVTTVPPGASVLWREGESDKLLGTTPLTLTRAPGTRLKVRLERDGYQNHAMELRFDQPGTVTMGLQREVEKAPPVAAAPPEATPEAKPQPKPHARPQPKAKPRARASKATAKQRPATKPAVVAPKPKPKPTDPGLVDDLM